MRVLVCGIAAIALIIAGALAMAWYRLAFEPVPGGAVQLAVDLRNLHVCHVGQPCVLAPLAPLPGMFPTLAAVTLWSSLGVAALVAFQAGLRILTGSAYDALTKVGYMVCLMALSIAIATAYMFGPEREGALIGAAAQAGVLLQRTWGPLTLIAGLVAGFATLYMAVAPESSDLAAAYKPIAPVPRPGDTRTRTPSVRIPFPEHTGLFPMLDGATGTAAGPRPPERRAVGSTPIPFRPRPPTEPDELELMRERPTTDMRARPTTDMRTPRTRTMAGVHPARERIDVQPSRERTITGVHPIREHTSTGAHPIGERTTTGVHPIGARPGTESTRERTTTGVHPVGARPAVPERTAVGSQPIGAIPDTTAPSAPPAAVTASTVAVTSSTAAAVATPASVVATPASVVDPADTPPAEPPPLRERAATGVYAIPAIALPGPGRAWPAAVEPARASAATTPPRRERSSTGPAAREITGSHAAREITGSHAAREITGSHAAREITGRHAAREITGSGPSREITSTHAARERTGSAPLREITGTHATRERTGSGPIREITGTHAARERTGSGPIREITGAHAARERTGSGAIREITGTHAARPAVRPLSGQSTPTARPMLGEPIPRGRPSTGQIAPIDGPVAGQPAPSRPTTGQTGAIPRPATGQVAPLARPATGQVAPRTRPATGQVAPRTRPATGQVAPRTRPATGQSAPIPRPATGQIARPPTGPVVPVPRTKTGPIIGAPPHLRQKLSYLASTAEITAGGIDARREDGLARLVLWRDVVGVVARRLPPVYDGHVFVDIVSSAGSTLRVVPWTRLTGEPITGEAIERPRVLIEHISAKCPTARIDPATRHFLETGTAAQLPDLDTLRAHDERLA